MRHPFRSLSIVVAMAAATLVIGATIARADIAPPDQCASPGQPCTNAGPQFNQAGTCVLMTCTKQVPSPDGGMMPVTYDCHRCTAGGSAGSGGSGTGGSGSGTGGSGTGGSGSGTGGSTTTTSSKSSGCAIAAGSRDRGPVALTVSLLAGLALVARRRRNTVE